MLFGQRVNDGFTGLLNHMQLLCTIYDPTARHYRFSYAIFIEIVIGALSLGAVALFVTRLWLQTRRARLQESRR